MDGREVGEMGEVGEGGGGVRCGIWLQLGLHHFWNDFLNLVFLDTDLLAKTLPGADSLDSSKKLRMT